MIYRRFRKIVFTLWNNVLVRNDENFLKTSFNFRNEKDYGHMWFSSTKMLYFLAAMGYITHRCSGKKKYVYAIECKPFDSGASSEGTGKSGSSEGSTGKSGGKSPGAPHLDAPRIPSRPDLPTYSRKEISKHKCKEDRIWVAYQTGVYDITTFVDKHPGGDQLRMAAGKSVEGFWLATTLHYNLHVLELLEQYRIGNLPKDEFRTEFKKRDVFHFKPERSSALIPLALEPYNAGVSEALLYAHPITPNDYHFIRSHGPVPNIDLNNYVLEVELHGTERKISLTLDELKKFPKHTVNATIMCAGNRRDEMMMVKPKKGLRWTLVATGNSLWTGAKLSDIMAKAGLTEKDTENYNHIQFDGFDTDLRGETFSMSIPIWKALDKRGDVIIAYEMNGAPIPYDHGYPVRAVVPGFAGARSVKWLRRVIAQPNECQTFNHQRLYKSFSPNVYYHNIDWSASPAVDELPVISAICDPLENGTVKVVDGEITVKGYAFSGGGQKIIRVDVSSDEGENWHTADFTYQVDTKPPRHYAWTLWSCKVPAPKSGKTCNIWAKAVDSSYNTQPERFEHIWNFRGVICNAYHKIKVNVS